MHIFIVIVSIDRANTLRHLLKHLNNEVKESSFKKIIVVGTKNEDFPDDYLKSNKEAYLISQKGMTAQRNVGMKKAIQEGADIITFLDDDFLPSYNYFVNLENLFLSVPSVSMADGDVIADGRYNKGYNYLEGMKIIKAINKSDMPNKKVEKIYSAYGCNMSVRVSCIGENVFDENLPLYSWLEDLDFSLKLAKKGEIVRDFSLKGVHLSEKSGRGKEIKYGYSQIINPIYIYQKNSLTFIKCIIFVLKAPLANLIKCFNPEPWVDRKGRLKGNIIAIFHLMIGRIDPTYILKL